MRKRYGTTSGIKRERTSGSPCWTDRPGSCYAWGQHESTTTRAMAESSGPSQLLADCTPVGSGSRTDGSAGRAGDTIVLCSGETSQPGSQTWVEEHVMMVVTWPCKLLSGLHVNGRRVTNMVTRMLDEEVLVAESGEEKSPKCTCIMTPEGHVVIGPRYTVLAGIIRPRTVGGGKKITRSIESQRLGARTADKGGRALGGRNMFQSIRGDGCLKEKRANNTVMRMEGRARPAPRWCPSDISMTEQRRLQ
jgi:hypothetical protein